MSRRVILTAGFNRSLHVLALAELLRRDGICIAGIVVVSPYNFRELRRLIRQRGTAFLWKAVPRLLGRRSQSNGPVEPSALIQLMEENRIPNESLRRWARRYDVPLRTVRSINDTEAVGFVETIRPDWVVYGGGGILHNSFIDAARGRILNAHSGPLPYIRGMNACEWSLLLGHPPTVTIHLINRGIDTGGSISEHPISVRRGDTIESLRERCVAIGVMSMRQAVTTVSEELPTSFGSAVEHRQCFVLAPAMRELLEQRLAQSVSVG